MSLALGLDRARDGFVMLVVLLAGVAAAVLAVRVPGAAGMREADGATAVLAKALAEGQGYRRVDQPGAPWETRTQPLYPWVMSHVWRTWPAFPQNVRALRIVNGVIAGLAVCVAYVAVRRVWGVPPWLAGLAGVLTALSLAWVRSIAGVAAEPLLTLLSLGALAWVPRGGPGRAETAGTRGCGPRALLGGLAAGAAYLTQVIGACAGVALVVGWLARRRFWAAGLVLVIALGAAAGWELWRRAAEQRNAGIPAAAVLRTEGGGAGAVNDRGPSLIGRVCEAPLTTFGLLLGPAEGWIGDRLPGGPWRVTVRWVGAFVVVVLLVIGGVVTWDRRRVDLHVYLLCSFILGGLGEDVSPSIVVPLLPLLWTWLLAGAQRLLLGWHVRLLATLDIEDVPPDAGAPLGEQLNAVLRPAVPRWPMAGVLVLGAVLLVAHLRTQLGPSGPEPARTAATARAAWAQRLGVTTPRAAVLAGNDGAYFSLMTGRRVVPLRGPEQLPYYEAAGVTHVFTMGEAEGDDGVVARLRAAGAKLRWLDTQGAFRLYQLGAAASLPSPP